MASECSGKSSRSMLVQPAPAADMYKKHRGICKPKSEVRRFMTSTKLVCLVLCAIASITGVCGRVAAQGTLATVSGRVFDPNAAMIIEATVTARNVDTGVETVVRTNEDGIYSLQNLSPGNYEFTVYKKGFKVISRPRVTLHVADTVSMNYTMQVGNVNETVRVEGGAPLINTESATVSTVIDREFAENLPMNGRSFQSLIQLTPGVFVVPSNANDPGQFSINGQPAISNHCTLYGLISTTDLTRGTAFDIDTYCPLHCFSSP